MLSHYRNQGQKQFDSPHKACLPGIEDANYVSEKDFLSSIWWASPFSNAEFNVFGSSTPFFCVCAAVLMKSETRDGYYTVVGTKHTGLVAYGDKSMALKDLEIL